MSTDQQIRLQKLEAHMRLILTVASERGWKGDWGKVAHAIMAASMEFPELGPKEAAGMRIVVDSAVPEGEIHIHGQKEVVKLVELQDREGP